VIVFRVIGGILLAVIAVKQWWAARDNPPDAVRRAGIVLLAVAVLSPAMLPWYPSWGMVLLAAAAWTTARLQWVVFGSIMLVIVYNPNGEDALYNVPYLFFWGLVAVVAAVSLAHPDPFKLAAGARSRARAVVTPVEPPAPAGVEQRAG
jgi:alpha-1,6-mannosyltransferase